MRRTGSQNHIVVKNQEGYNPFRLVSNEEYCKNLNAIIAYYQVSKGETKKRFVSSSDPWGEDSREEELLAS